jgi:hypothetical protein
MDFKVRNIVVFYVKLPLIITKKVKMKSLMLITALVIFISSCSPYRENMRPDLAVCDEVQAANNRRLAREGFSMFGQGLSGPKTIRAIFGSYTTVKYRGSVTFFL